LLKSRNVSKQAVDSSLLDPLLPLFLGLLGCDFSLSFFLIELSLPFNTPLILADSRFAIPDLSS
jgi:hypothetical protein